MKKIYFVEENCIGCKRCEVGCATEHSESKNPIIAYKYEKVKPTSRIIVEEEKALSFAFACRHCEDPDCVKACIAGAMYKDEETGKTLYKPEKCVGCYSCIMACSFGAIHKDLHNKERKQVVKCDLCPGRNTPACVEICPNRAIVFEER